MTESNERGARSAECGVRSEEQTAQAKNPQSAIPNLQLSAVAERLQSYLGLLRETIARAMGAQNLKPDPALTGLICRAAELEREASVELLRLGTGPTATASPAPSRVCRLLSPLAEADVGADVRGALRIGQTLVVGPLLIERAENHLAVRLGGKAKVEVLLPAGDSGAFRARTDGRWYPIISTVNTDGGGGAAGPEGRGTGDASAPSASFLPQSAIDSIPARDVVERLQTAQGAGFETGFRHAMDVVGRRLAEIDAHYRLMHSKTCRQALDDTALALKETRYLVPDVPAGPVAGPKDLPLAVIGQGATRREIREEDL